MKRREITIPVSTIAGGLVMGTGICASVLVDEALKQVKCNKVIKGAGRTGISVMISAGFAPLAFVVSSMDFLDIKIKIGKKESKESNNNEGIKPCREKDFDRTNRAVDLWESILNETYAAKEYLDEHPGEDVPTDEFISIDDINKFTEKMHKLSKRIGFTQYPIVISPDSLKDMIESILNSIDGVADNIRECYKYCYGKEVSGHDDISIDVSDTAESEIAAGIDEAKDNLKAQVAAEIYNIFNSSDVDLTADQLDFLINNAEDKTIIDIVEKYYNGDITVADARDRLAAYIDAINSENAEEDVDNTADVTEEIAEAVVEKSPKGKEKNKA